MMKKIFVGLLIILPVYISLSLYFLDKDYFLCPIQYSRGFLIRSDTKGDGSFAANRNGKRWHRGIDLVAALGTPVMAARSGKVILTRDEKFGMGNYIILQHANNLTTLYGHLSKVFVSLGQFVRQGEVIGLSGKTGNANSPGMEPHLHFEVKKEGIPQDPLFYFQ